MASISLVSCDPQCYYNGFHPVGETFTVREKADAQTLKALGRAKDAPHQTRTYQRREVVAADPVETPIPDDKPKRTYRRRDLTAEE